MFLQEYSMRLCCLWETDLKEAASSSFISLSVIYFLNWLNSEHFLRIAHLKKYTFTSVVLAIRFSKNVVVADTEIICYFGDSILIWHYLISWGCFPWDTGENAIFYFLSCPGHSSFSLLLAELEWCFLPVPYTWQWFILGIPLLFPFTTGVTYCLFNPT